MASIPYRYIKAWAAAPVPARDGELSPPRFLTLSREPGAGGKLVIRALQEELARRGEPAWRVFDAEEFRRVARAAHLAPSARLVEEERYEGALGDFFQRAMGASSESAVMHAAFLAMRREAIEGRIVFLGRGAVCVTRDLGGLHVRLVASYATRVERLAARYDLPPEQARRLERELSRTRRRFFRGHFERELDDPHLYDVTIDTDRVGIARTAGMIAEAIAAPLAAPATH